MVGVRSNGTDMSFGTPPELAREIIEMRKGKARLEEMSEFDRQLVGADKAKHLIIPMNDVYNLRRIAAVLQQLAADFDALSRRHDIRARSIIMEAQAFIDHANRDIRVISGKLKPMERAEADEH